MSSRRCCSLSNEPYASNAGRNILRLGTWPRAARPPSPIVLSCSPVFCPCRPLPSSRAPCSRRIADRSGPRVAARSAAQSARSTAVATCRGRLTTACIAGNIPAGPVVPGPVITPGMSTRALLSTAVEDDCCAVADTAPAIIITQTPGAASTLRIVFIVCAPS
jgi:hypothetical protein